MEVFHCLPIELKFLVLTHLDCQTLVQVLRAYPLLQQRVVILSDESKRSKSRAWIPPEKINRPTVRSLLPNVRYIDMADLNALETFPAHTYLKIFEFAPDLVEESAEVSYGWDPVCYDLGVCCSSRGDVQPWHYRPLWRNALPLMDHTSIITWAAGGYPYDLVKGWLLHLAHRTGATYLPLLDSYDGKPITALPRSQRTTKSPKYSWHMLTNVNLQHEDHVFLDIVPHVKLLSVEFTTRGRAVAPVLEVVSAPKLNTLQVRYHGELVPVFKVRANLSPDKLYIDVMSELNPDINWDEINPQKQPNTALELTRVHPEQALPAMDRNVAITDRASYNGDLSIMDNFYRLSFSGIPDWFVMMGSYRCCGVFKWYRSDPTKLRHTRLKPTLNMPWLTDLHICSMIENDCPPYINNKKSFTEPPECHLSLATLDLTVCAPGFQINGLLSRRTIESLIIRSLPSVMAYPGKYSALLLSEGDLAQFQSSDAVAIAGDVDLSKAMGLGLSFPQVRSILEIDLTCTASNSLNNHVDLRLFPLGNWEEFSSVTFRCSTKQRISLSLHKSCNIQQRLAHLQAELYLDLHIARETTFEGRKILDHELEVPSPETLIPPLFAHFRFDHTVKRFVHCGWCEGCLRYLSDSASDDQ